MPVTDNQLTIVRDQRTLKGVTVNKFDEILRASLLPKLPTKVVLEV